MDISVLEPTRCSPCFWVSPSAVASGSLHTAMSESCSCSGLDNIPANRQVVVHVCRLLKPLGCCPLVLGLLALGVPALSVKCGAGVTGDPLSTAKGHTCACLSLCCPGWGVPCFSAVCCHLSLNRVSSQLHTAGEGPGRNPSLQPSWHMCGGQAGRGHAGGRCQLSCQQRRRRGQTKCVF